MTLPCLYILSDDTPGVSNASGVLFFCDEDCRERYQPPAPITRLQSGDHPGLSIAMRCATCNAAITPSNVIHLPDPMRRAAEDDPRGAADR